MKRTFKFVIVDFLGNVLLNKTERNFIIEKKNLLVWYECRVGEV